MINKRFLTSLNMFRCFLGVFEDFNILNMYKIIKKSFFQIYIVKMFYFKDIFTIEPVKKLEI